MKAWSEFHGDIKFNEPLSKYTYYKIGGPADVVVSPSSLGEIKEVAEILRNTGEPFMCLGMASNVLIADTGFKGTVIRLHKLNTEFSRLGENHLQVGAGLPIMTLLRKTAEQGLAGLELWSGVPGSVGGAVVMNAGTSLGETKDCLSSVEVFSLGDGSVRTLKAPFEYEYRKNHFLKKDDIVMSAVLKVQSSEPKAVKARLAELLEKRKQSQPVDLPSCGSVFKNPRPLSAWQVIEKLGLRGHRIGGAQFSEKHSNFIVNTGGAKASDVKGLIDLAKTRAKAELGVTLEEEVKLVGF